MAQPATLKRVSTAASAKAAFFMELFPLIMPGHHKGRRVGALVQKSNSIRFISPLHGTSGLPQSKPRGESYGFFR